MQVAGDTLQHHDVQFGERNKRHIFHTTPAEKRVVLVLFCLLYTSPSPRD